MGNKYQRPSGAYGGQGGLTNRTKYIDDSNATPRRAISSSKMDGDFNYLIDAVNNLDDASGSRTSIAERLDVSLNADGTLKVSVAGALDEFVVHQNPGTIARTDNSTFTLAGGDFRAIYSLSRRVRVVVGGQPLVGDVASCSFAGSITTVSLVDITDTNGNLAVLAGAPTQVAYGPLTPGSRGNVPRRTDGLTFTLGANTVAFNNDAGDLALRHNGTIVARVGAGGLSGLAPGSVATATLAAAVQQALNPVGLVSPFAGSTAPTGWLLCGGQAVSRTTFTALFGALGTTYGAGDGTTTFNVPDLRGRVAFGLDNMGGTAANRLTTAGSGVNGVALGAGGGNQLMQQHTHSISDPGHSHTLPANLALVAGAATAANATTSGLTALGSTASATTGITLQNTGTGTSQNIPPALVLNYIIKT
jgi:microcystin-dependent protein